jgi:catechol 2,3-dioxygenase
METKVMGIRVERVGHVVLKVRELRRSVQFYTQVLGLREVGRYGQDMVFFSADGSNHHDLAVQEVGRQASAADPSAVGLVHVALKIGNSIDALRAAKSHLEAAGVPILRLENHVVSNSIYLADPDGNELEVYVDGDPQLWRANPSAVASVLPLEL